MTEQTRKVEVTNETYGLWLRAQRPPWEFFFGLTQLEQEALASIGDDHMEEMSYSLSLMLTNTQAYQTGRALMQQDPEAEASAALAAAQRLASNLTTATAEQGASNEGMAGIGQKLGQDLQFTNTRAPNLFGKEPD